MRKKLIIKMATAIMGSALLITGLGQGCSQWSALSMDGSDGSSVSQSYENDPAYKPGVATVALIYGKQGLDHFNACLGSGRPSERTLAMYNSKRGSISESGAVGTLTAPMLMAATSVAGEVCKDLIENEKTAPRIFMGVNFSSTSLPADGVIQNAMKRIARSCWSRDEDRVEAEIIMDSVRSVFSGANGPNTAHDAMLFMCTSMLGSLDSIVL